jgi:hypothetical protein
MRNLRFYQLQGLCQNIEETVLVHLTERILTDKNFDRQNFDRQNFDRQNFDRQEF